MGCWCRGSAWCCKYTCEYSKWSAQNDSLMAYVIAVKADRFKLMCINTGQKQVGRQNKRKYLEGNLAEDGWSECQAASQAGRTEAGRVWGGITVDNMLRSENETRFHTCTSVHWVGSGAVFALQIFILMFFSATRSSWRDGVTDKKCYFYE